jgi:hypothetical protein
MAVGVAAGEEEKGPGFVDLRGGKIRDVPTKVSVPVSADLSVVAALPDRFWVQCPRHLPVPTSLAGAGVILQYLNARGGSTSLLYFGAVDLPEALEGEALPARAERAVNEFVADLAAKYAGVDWALTSTKVTAAAAALRVDGKKVSGWRTGRYDLHPGDYGGPESAYVGECLFIQPAGTEKLVYLALDSKSGGTTLDMAAEGLSIQKTSAVNEAGRIVQLNDLAEGEGGRFPVRLLSYESPPGFVTGPTLAGLKGEWVYAEDRIDARGQVTASHRIEQRDADTDRPFPEEAELERTSMGGKAAGPLHAVELGTKGMRAYVFAYDALQDGRASRARTAVFRLDDKTLFFSWYTFGDAAMAEKDGAAFDRLLGTMQMAVRW